MVLRVLRRFIALLLEFRKYLLRRIVDCFFHLSLGLLIHSFMPPPRRCHCISSWCCPTTLPIMLPFSETLAPLFITFTPGLSIVQIPAAFSIVICSLRFWSLSNLDAASACFFGIFSGFNLFSNVIFCFYVSYSQVYNLSRSHCGWVTVLFPCFSSVLLSLVFLPDLFDTFIDLMRCFVPMDQKSVISQPTSDSTNSANIHSDSTSLNSHHEKDGCGCSIGGGVSTSPYPRKVPTNSMAILIRRTSNDGSVTPHE